MRSADHAIKRADAHNQEENITQIREGRIDNRQIYSHIECNNQNRKHRWGLSGAI